MKSVFSSFEGDFKVSQNIEMNYFNGNEYEVLYPTVSLTNTVNSLSATNVSYSNSNTSSIITSNQVQGAIDDLFQSVSDGKSRIAEAITDKGVSTSSSASFATMARNIKKIEQIKVFDFMEYYNGKPYLEASRIQYDDTDTTFTWTVPSEYRRLDLLAGGICFINGGDANQTTSRNQRIYFYFISNKKTFYNTRFSQLVAISVQNNHSIDDGGCSSGTYEYNIYSGKLVVTVSTGLKVRDDPNDNRIYDGYLVFG